MSDGWPTDNPTPEQQRFIEGVESLPRVRWSRFGRFRLRLLAWRYRKSAWSNMTIDGSFWPEGEQ